MVHGINYVIFKHAYNMLKIGVCVYKNMLLIDLHDVYLAWPRIGGYAK